VDAACFKRYFPRNCSGFHGNEFEAFRDHIKRKDDKINVIQGSESYNENTQKFETSVTISGNDLNKSQFCSWIAEAGGEDWNAMPCQEFLSSITGDEVRDKSISVQGSCSSKYHENNDDKRVTDSRLTETLRAYNRAVFYDITRLPPENENELSTSRLKMKMPLLTQNNNFAAQYANESLLFYLHSSKQNPACVRYWHAQANENITGIFDVTFDFRIDESCSDKPYNCAENWTTTNVQQQVACEGSFCYERAKCQPNTCAINEVGDPTTGGCKSCNAGTYMLTAGALAKQKTSCNPIPSSNTACAKIIDKKIDACSSKMGIAEKNNLSLILDVECNEDGSVIMLWDGSMQKVTSTSVDIKNFIAEILNVTSTEISLEFERRKLTLQTTTRRRLLQDDGNAEDDMTTTIVLNATSSANPSNTTSPPPPSPTTSPPSSSPPSAKTRATVLIESSPSDNSAIIAFFAIASLIIFACAVVFITDPGNRVSVTLMPENQYRPLYIDPGLNSRPVSGFSYPNQGNALVQPQTPRGQGYPALQPQTPPGQGYPALPPQPPANDRLPSQNQAQ
tara:strand:- start:8801 stop:10495 length:1695 start_codon:yes stop_codon:yes gene_type:complete